MRPVIKKGSVLLLVAAVICGGCKKWYDLPAEKDYLSSNVNFTNKTFEPVLGRNSIMGGFNADNSTAPLSFEIVNARYGDGRPMTDLFKTAPTYVWTAAYTGLEKSLDEIEAKRKVETHPLFEIRSSGELIMWASSNNQLITPRAIDSTSFAQDTRYFDLKVKNTGGEVLIKDFVVRPWRERPYEPSNDMNIYTGGIAPNPKDPTNLTDRDYIRPFVYNVVGIQSEKYLVSNDDRKDVVAYIRPLPVAGEKAHVLRIKVLGKDSLPINPAVFNETDWKNMVHGFNMLMTNEYVQYDVAYPIPLVEIPTYYARGGTRAHAELIYSRLGFGGSRVLAGLGLDFAIYQEGDWEIVFHFKTENPKFEND
jgi:hypothetical protein